jgi:hypothetical protein
MKQPDPTPETNCKAMNEVRFGEKGSMNSASANSTHALSSTARGP